jgi:hypothetical protein
MHTRAVPKVRARHGAGLWLFCSILVLGLSAPAMAKPKGPNGETCSSSETNVKHDIKGKHYTCDKCVVSSCSTSGGQISNCTKTTYWSNCVAAASSGHTRIGQAVHGGVMAPPKATKSPTKPQVNHPRMNKQ